MKISIVTATYNSTAYIARCIASVNEQTHESIEFIVIDGASKDNTVAIIQSIPNRVETLVSEPDKGIYDALNKGIQLATGDVIGFLHADDTFASKNIIEDISRQFINSETDGIYGNLVFTNSEDKIVRTWRSNPFQRKNIKFGWMPPHPTLFLRKEVYEKHGGFDISFRIAGDYDFMLRVMNDPEIHLQYLPEVITKMSMGGASTGSFQNIIRKSREDLRALRNNGYPFPLAVLAAKNIRKLPQLFRR